MRKLTISRYKSRFDKGKTLAVGDVSWDQLVDILTNYKVTSETYAEYSSMASLDKLAIKDVSYFVGGEFCPPIRKTFNLKTRCLLTLDLDHLESWDLAEIKATFGRFAYIVHSSHSHSPDKPRLRLVIPLTRDVTPEEYEPLARQVANMLDMDMFDDTTYQFSRIMFLPSCSSDAETYTEVNAGEWLDPDEFLGLYEDWSDFGSWPRSSRQDFVRPSASKAQDPFTKPGIIGAFNRAYSIPEAIEAFELPYEESGQGDGRYTYTSGTSADGAVFYEDDGHLFSHHESDPAHGNQNAWDLVRLHRFRDDGPEHDATPMLKRPTMQAMQLLASKDPLVQAELAAGMFDDISGEEDVPEGNADEIPSVPKVKQLTFADAFDWIQQRYNTPDTKPEEDLDEFFDLIAIANLGQSKNEQLVGMMQEYLKQNNVKITKTTMMKDIKVRAKDLVTRGTETDELKDIQVEFLQSFLDGHYKGGEYLRRTGRQFWTFCGTHWKRRHEEYIQGQLVHHLVSLRTDPKMRKKNKALAAAVGEGTTSSIQASLWSMFQAMTTYHTESTTDEADPMELMKTNLDPAINTASGTIRFREDGKHKLFPSDPLDSYTSVIDVVYDKDAECPVWNAFCRTSFSLTTDPTAMQRMLEELMGYIINQSRDLRAWVLFYGGTGSGKSTVGKVLDELLGESAKNMSMGNYAEGGNSHATAGLIGMQMLLDDDYKTGQLLDDGFLKSVSEEKRMDANPKGRDEFPFVARVVPIILSNSMPATRDTSGALADRAIIFPFAHMVAREDRDTKLSRKLKAELPGILARCVKAFGALTKRGDWSFPADCTTAWRRWINQSNPLNLFITDCVTPLEGHIVKSSDVWEAYQLWWAQETGDDGKRSGRLHRNTFYERMEQTLGVGAIHHREMGKSWRGYKLDERFITFNDETDEDWDS